MLSTSPPASFSISTISANSPVKALLRPLPNSASITSGRVWSATESVSRLSGRGSRPCARSAARIVAASPEPGVAESSKTRVRR